MDDEDIKLANAILDKAKPKRVANEYFDFKPYSYIACNKCVFSRDSCECVAMHVDVGYVQGAKGCGMMR